MCRADIDRGRQRDCEAQRIAGQREPRFAVEGRRNRCAIPVELRAKRLARLREAQGQRATFVDALSIRTDQPGRIDRDRSAAARIGADRHHDRHQHRIFTFVNVVGETEQFVALGDRILWLSGAPAIRQVPVERHAETHFTRVRPVAVPAIVGAEPERDGQRLAADGRSFGHQIRFHALLGRLRGQRHCPR